MRSLRIVIASLIGVAAVAATATAASGGGAVLLLPVQVTKAVEGTPPPGAQFVVDITCDTGVADPPQVVFDGVGSEIVGIPAAANCTFTETETGDATQTITVAGCINPPEFCTVEVTSSTSATVSLLPPDGAGFEAEVTFTNFFEPPPGEPAPLALEVTPAFTG